MIQGFDHLHIRCKDLEVSVQWWKQVMGATEVGRSEVLGRPIVKLDLAGFSLAFSPQKKVELVCDSGCDCHWGAYQIGFTVEDIATATTEFKAKGAVFTTEGLKPRPDMVVSFIAAPDGIELELMQYL